MYARIVFGVSSVVSGIVLLMWHDEDMWQRLHAWPLLAAVVVWLLALAQIGGGIGVMIPRAARIASIVAGAPYAIFALVLVPGMIATPAEPGQYVNFFEQLAIVCGAVAVYAATETEVTLRTMLARIARIVLGICTVSFAWAQVVYLQYTASLVPTWIPPGQVFWTNLTTAAFGLAALAMLINFRAQLAMRLMAVMIAFFGLLVWVPHIVAKPQDLANWNEISANYLIAAAAWLVADIL